MNRKTVAALFFLLTTGVVALGPVLGVKTEAGEGHRADEHGQSHQEAKKGPHGGRLLLGDDGFAIEMTIYEPGIPPQSRVYAYGNRAAVAPGEVELLVELHRFDRVDTLHYTNHGEFLFGDEVVKEPHSFTVKVRATYKGKEYAWEYESFEGRIQISDESAKLSGVKTETAKARHLVERLPVLGQVGFNQDDVKHVAVRYAGVVRSLNKGIGDYVKKGESLGMVLGTESLSEFSVQAPGSGRVVEKRVTVGEVIHSGDVMFVVADLTTVWVDFTVYRRDAMRVASGQVVRIVPGDGIDELVGTLAYLAPVGDSPSQSVVARAVVQNPDGNLRPGLFVKGEIEIGTIEAPVTVRREAIQTFRDWQVVFRNRGTLYEIAIVEPGLIDGDFVQILSGLSPGDRYVAHNSFIVKADIGKAGASHDH
jgi:cobalt-zinc-cadmium efflux system membrane fusion protein